MKGKPGMNLMSSGWGCVRLCGSRWHIKPDHVVVVKKNSFICLWHWKERSSYLQCFIPNWGSFRMKTNTENDFKVNSLVFFNDRQLVSMTLIWVNWLKQRRIISKHINIHVSQTYTHTHTQNAFTVWGQHTHSLLINKTYSNDLFRSLISGQLSWSSKQSAVHVIAAGLSLFKSGDSNCRLGSSISLLLKTSASTDGRRDCLLTF